MNPIYPPVGADLTAYQNELRRIPTSDLLRDIEFYQWELADLDDDPFTDYKEQSLTYLRFKLRELEAERERRLPLRDNCYAPDWPNEPAAARKVWDEVKARVDLQATIEQLGAVTWIGAGPIRRCRCPFPWHDDATPSFVLYPDHWFCFGCGLGGSVIDFVAAIQGFTPRQAVNVLAALLAPAIIVHRREEPAPS